MMSPLRRWSLPWNQVRGFGVMRNGTSGGRLGDDVGEGYMYQIVVVDRTGRARGLPGLEYRRSRRQARPRWAVEKLCELDAFRRSRQ